MVFPPSLIRFIPGDQLVGHMVVYLTDTGMVQAIIGGTKTVLPYPVAKISFYRAARCEQALIGHRSGLRGIRIGRGSQIPQGQEAGGNITEGLIPAYSLPLPRPPGPHPL